MVKQHGALLIRAGLIMSVLIFGHCTTNGQGNTSTKGFISIFDGKTLKDWEGDTTYWRVEHGNYYMAGR